MEGLFTLENLFTLGMLVMLQAVLGFDNLLYIIIESQRVEKSQQSKLRKTGIWLAVLFRLVLLFALLKLLSYFTEPMFTLGWEGVVEGSFNLRAVVVLLGGVFIIYTAMKEIWHMLSLEDAMAEQKEKKSSFTTALVLIVTMNVVFSFDSILSAMALTDNFYVMATAILIGALLMVWLADTIAAFLQKNRMYEVLGLFILFIVGIMLLSEGGHIAHLKFFGHEITQMSKATFYFVIVILVITEIVQSRYSKKLSKMKMAHNDLAE
ncbi:TerC family protein [Marinicella rhabdoformis]|uniref:TerC family protein n=1 Tax=Marinicella rhabdoformis TaxID=2580566 RepID=UPI0012AEE00B|nr:tellurium resistance protein TerC [Marinicella rhabdoformis]